MAEPTRNKNMVQRERDELVKGNLSDYEINKTASLLGAVWPKSGFTSKYLNWLYRDNPVGHAEVYNVWDGEQIAAHYAAIPIKARIFGHEEKGLFSLNTAVHPEHRGKGYFKTLANKTFDDAYMSGSKFVIGVANANSTMLFKRQLGFQIVSPLTVKIGIGITKKKCVKIEQPDYARIWDDSTLYWRLRRPGASYYYTDNYGSVAILRHTGRYGIWTKMIELKSFDYLMLNKMVFRWNPLLLWIGMDKSCDWSKSLYINIPDRFKPSPLNLIFKDLSGSDRTLDPDNVVLSLLDFDAY